MTTHLRSLIKLKIVIFNILLVLLFISTPLHARSGGEIQRDHSGKVWYVEKSIFGLKKKCHQMKKIGETWYWINSKGKWEEFSIFTFEPEESDIVEDYIIDGHDCPR